MGVIVLRFVRMGVIQVNIELNPLNARFALASGMQVVTLEIELGEFGFQVVEVEAQVEHGTQEHVTTDSAENIEIQGLHGSVRNF